jgi:hypothetical protein
LTISAYVIGKHSIKQVNISEPLSVRKEMLEHPEEKKEMRRYWYFVYIFVFLLLLPPPSIIALSDGMLLK